MDTPRDASMASARPKAVTMMTNGKSERRASVSIARAVAMPSMPGMRQSISTSSTGSVSAVAASDSMASAPLRATATRIPIC